jgi:D-alanine-D-alanine ligase-like ATP-grasp enzyme
MVENMTPGWEEKILTYDRDAIYREAREAQPLENTIVRPPVDKGRANVIPRVHILVPNFVSEEEVRSEEERISHNYGKREYLDELIAMFDEIHRDAVLYLVRMSDYKQVIDLMPRGEVVLNLCDGADVDGVPGPSVTRYLEEKGIPYCGCDYLFMEGTTSKYAMKEQFVRDGVSTARFVHVSKEKPLKREDTIFMQYPLFVKAEDSYGSIGLSNDSVCHTFEECETQVKKMQETFENILVEEFIQGAEFSLLVIGDSRFPDSQIEVFPPAQRVFDASIPPQECFLSYKLVWEDGGVAYRYEAVDKDSELLMDLAKRAYDSVGGNGFGRIDVRRRDATNEYFVLEVNATCGVGYDASSAQILKLGGKGACYLLERVLSIGGNDPSKKNKGKQVN